MAVGSGRACAAWWSSFSVQTQAEFECAAAQEQRWRAPVRGRCREHAVIAEDRPRRPELEVRRVVPGGEAERRVWADDRVHPYRGLDAHAKAGLDQVQGRPGGGG